MLFIILIMVQCDFATGSLKSTFSEYSWEGRGGGVMKRVRGFAKNFFSKKSEITTEVGGWVSLGICC